MAHAIHKICSFRIAGPYTLTIHYNDDFSNTIDFRPILRGPMYGPLKDIALFESVTLDQEVHTLVWPNGADFDPELLRNWHDYESELQARASTWQTAK
jgi:hypothetical protein